MTEFKEDKDSVELQDKQTLPDFPTRLARRVVYESAWVNLYLDKVLFPDGRIIEDYHLVDSPKQAVGVLVSNEAGELLLEHVYRYPTGRMEWEIPAGAIELGEDILVAAQRETYEETGYETHDHRLLYTFNPANGNTIYVFFIASCRAGECTGKIDVGEIKAFRWMKRTEIEDMIRQRVLQDGFTLAAVLFWWANLF